MGMRTWFASVLSATVIAAGLILAIGVSASAEAEQADAMTPNPSLQDTARLLGYMWGDGEQNGAGVWDVNGPSGTSTLIEELIERHGGTFVDRNRLRFTLPAPYDWDEWITGLPDDSSTVRAAVQDPNFLAAVLETEATVGGQIYDQSACCVNGYTVGRLTDLRDVLRSSGYSTASIRIFNNPNSGRVDVAASQWDNMRRDLEFVCPVVNSDIRIPGGGDLDRYGDLRWIGSGSAWADFVRVDCTTGRSVPDASPQVGTCSTTRDGNNLRIDWTFTRGDVVVRIDGQFVETVSARDGSWRGTVSGGEHDVEIRVNAFGERASSNCGANNGGGGGDCIATAAGNSVFLDWENFGESSYSIRRNGRWVKSVTGTSTTASGNVGDDWVVRFRQNGSTVDVPCESTGDGGDGPCTITNQADGVRVDWNGVAGVDDYQVRRNGSWIGEATGMSRFDDTSGSTNADYEIRYFINGNRNAIRCG